MVVAPEADVHVRPAAVAGLGHDPRGDPARVPGHDHVPAAVPGASRVLLADRRPPKAAAVADAPRASRPRAPNLDHGLSNDPRKCPNLARVLVLSIRSRDRPARRRKGPGLDQKVKEDRAVVLR